MTSRYWSPPVPILVVTSLLVELSLAMVMEKSYMLAEQGSRHSGSVDFYG